jgi:hypothetical protein
MTPSRSLLVLCGALLAAAPACVHDEPGRNRAAEYAEEVGSFNIGPPRKPDAGTAAPEARVAAAASGSVASTAVPTGGPGFDTAAPPDAAAGAEAEIAHALDDFHGAAARADEERYFRHFAASAVFLGTDASERWDVAAFRAYAHPFFARGRAWSFRATRRAISVAPGGAVAWFDEDLATPNLGPARGSGVLLREGSAWKVAQYNLALTVPNEKMAAVKRVIEGAKAN